MQNFNALGSFQFIILACLLLLKTKYFVRSQSVAATPDREVKRKWSISASTDYLNKTGKDNYMARNNPIGKHLYNIQFLTEAKL